MVSIISEWPVVGNKVIRSKKPADEGRAVSVPKKRKSRVNGTNAAVSRAVVLHGDLAREQARVPVQAKDPEQDLVLAQL